MTHRRISAAWGAAVTALMWASPCSSQSPFPAKRLSTRTNLARKVDRLVEAGRRELHLPSVSIAIMQGHTLILAKGYGVADREAGASATERTIYAIGSLSKQFTAAAIMKLSEEGRLQLDEPVSKYLPEFRSAPTPVPTIRNLLQQNSGLPAWDDLPEFQDVDARDPDRFELYKMVDVIARQPPLYRPGDWWSYSNSNYTALAAVIERVTERRHDDYLASTFFDRLGLRSMGGCASARVASAGQRAVGYLDSRAYALRPLTEVKARAFTGAGGLCSNVVDLATWMRALVDGEVVSADSFRQMTTAVPVRAGFTPPYGFGVSLVPLAGKRAVWHMGSMSGYIAVLAYFPEHDLIISALTNARRVHLDQVVKDVTRELLRLQAPRVRDLASTHRRRSAWRVFTTTECSSFESSRAARSSSSTFRRPGLRRGSSTRAAANSRRRAQRIFGCGSSLQSAKWSGSPGSGQSCVPTAAARLAILVFFAAALGLPATCTEPRSNMRLVELGRNTVECAAGDARR